MGENFNINKVGQQAEATQPHSLADGLLSREQLAHLTDSNDGALLKRAVETSEQFNKVLQEAFDLINPIIARINQLPPEHKQTLVASNFHEEGPGYDLMRKHCV